MPRIYPRSPSYNTGAGDVSGPGNPYEYGNPVNDALLNAGAASSGAPDIDGYAPPVHDSASVAAALRGEGRPGERGVETKQIINLEMLGIHRGLLNAIKAQLKDKTDTTAVDGEDFAAAYFQAARKLNLNASQTLRGYTSLRLEFENKDVPTPSPFGEEPIAKVRDHASSLGDEDWLTSLHSSKKSGAEKTTADGSKAEADAEPRRFRSPKEFFGGGDVTPKSKDGSPVRMPIGSQMDFAKFGQDLAPQAPWSSMPGGTATSPIPTSGMNKGAPPDPADFVPSDDTAAKRAARWNQGRSPDSSEAEKTFPEPYVDIVKLSQHDPYAAEMVKRMISSSPIYSAMLAGRSGSRGHLDVHTAEMMDNDFIRLSSSQAERSAWERVIRAMESADGQLKPQYVLDGSSKVYQEPVETPAKQQSRPPMGKAAVVGGVLGGLAALYVAAQGNKDKPGEG